MIRCVFRSAAALVCAVEDFAHAADWGGSRPCQMVYHSMRWNENRRSSDLRNDRGRGRLCLFRNGNLCRKRHEASTRMPVGAPWRM